MKYVCKDVTNFDRTLKSTLGLIAIQHTITYENILLSKIKNLFDSHYINNVVFGGFLIFVCWSAGFVSECSRHLCANSLQNVSPQDSFGVSLSYTHARCPVTAKTAFRLVFMWRSLFRNIHCNRAFQEKLFVEIPLAPHKYWVQWLVLEEIVPLPSVRLPCSDVEKLWGITTDLFQDQLQGGHYSLLSPEVSMLNSSLTCWIIFLFTRENWRLWHPQIWMEGAVSSCIEASW